MSKNRFTPPKPPRRQPHGKSRHIAQVLLCLASAAAGALVTHAYDKRNGSQPAVPSWAQVGAGDSAPFSSSAYGLTATAFGSYGSSFSAFGLEGGSPPAAAASAPDTSETSIIAALTPAEPASSALPSTYAASAAHAGPTASAVVLPVRPVSVSAPSPAASVPAAVAEPTQVPKPVVVAVKPRWSAPAPKHTPIKAEATVVELPKANTSAGPASIPNFVLPPATAVAPMVPAPSPASAAVVPAPARTASAPPAKAEDPGIRNPVVVAKAADGVFVRINEKTTLQVKKGSTVPGLGALISIDADGAHFEHATVPQAK